MGKKPYAPPACEHLSSDDPKAVLTMKYLCATLMESIGVAPVTDAGAIDWMDALPPELRADVCPTREIAPILANLVRLTQVGIQLANTPEIDIQGMFPEEDMAVIEAAENLPPEMEAWRKRLLDSRAEVVDIAESLNRMKRTIEEPDMPEAVEFLAALGAELPPLPVEAPPEGADITQAGLLASLTPLINRTANISAGMAESIASLASFLRDAERTLTRLEQWPADTSLEVMELSKAFADGKYGRNYTADESSLAIVHRSPNSHHITEFRLTEDERRAAMDAGTLGLERLSERIRGLDADGALCLQYVLNCIRVNIQRVGGMLVAGDTLLGLDDLIAKLGWNPRSTAERKDMRRQVFDYLLAGQQAWVIGDRGGKYKDPERGVIDTEVASRPFAIMSYTMPQRGLYPALDVPLEVSLQVSAEWKRMLGEPKVRQYLDGLEAVMAIPGGKPGGAWARSMAQVLFQHWRVMSGWPPRERTLRTRRELLCTVPPKLAPVESMLEGDKPGRALTYWKEAVRMLVTAGVVADTGEAQAVLTAKRPAGYGWQDEWLDTPVDLQPANAALFRFNELAATATAKRTKRGRKPGTSGRKATEQ